MKSLTKLHMFPECINQDQEVALFSAANSHGEAEQKHFALVCLHRINKRWSFQWFYQEKYKIKGLNIIIDTNMENAKTKKVER